MIIHISGPSGSGKTTLGNRLSKLPNTIVIDTDDIDDPNSMKIIHKYSFETKKDEKLFDKELEKLNKEQVNNILNENKGKNIIFVGFFHAGMRNLEKKVDKGFSIKVDPNILWRQYNLRTAASIYKNFNEIKKLLESKMDEEKIHFIFSKKFGIRNGFECEGPNDMKEHLKKQKQREINNGYFYNTSDKIFNEISKILS
jgi:adenylate kinase family enzyme